MSILKDLFHYDGNGWWRIPKTEEAKANPKLEHPFGKFLGMSKDFLIFITSGKGHASPAYYWAIACLLYTSPSPRDLSTSRMPSSA